MATTSTSPPPSPPSASISDNSAVSQTPPKPNIDDPSSGGNGVVDSQEKKPEIAPKLEYTDTKEELERYRKLEAEYTRYLNAKYFSNKDIFGGIIFDEKTAINNGTIKSSRWPGTRSYADPLQAFEEQTSNSPTSGPETPTNISNGKFHAKS